MNLLSFSVQLSGAGRVWATVAEAGAMDPTAYWGSLGGVVAVLSAVGRYLYKRLETVYEAGLKRERERADRLEAALQQLMSEVGPRQSQAVADAMKVVTEAVKAIDRGRR